MLLLRFFKRYLPQPPFVAVTLWRFKTNCPMMSQGQTSASTNQPEEKIDLSIDSNEIKRVLLAIASIAVISAFWWVA